MVPDYGLIYLPAITSIFVEAILMVEAAPLPLLTLIASGIWEDYCLSICQQTTLQHTVITLTVIMLMASVSLTDAIHESTFGHLYVPQMKLVPMVRGKATALAPTYNIQTPHHNHPALLGMITSVIPPRKRDGFTHFTQIIPYGTELVVE